jgi:L-lactate utilization protein LutC
MSADDKRRPSVEDDDARRADLAACLASLKRRHAGMPTRTGLPDDPETIAREVARDPDVATRFEQAASAVGASVHAATSSDWLEVIVELLHRYDVRSAAVPTAFDGFLDARRVAELKQRLATAGVAAASDTDDEALFSAGAAITGAVAAIAEHGSLACESRPALARGSSLIPPIHIAVVAATQVLPDLCDYFAVLSGRPELPAAVSLLTGPSKTADIEGVLVTGVHGPGAVHVILVRDA